MLFSTADILTVNTGMLQYPIVCLEVNLNSKYRSHSEFLTKNFGFDLYVTIYTKE